MKAVSKKKPVSKKKSVSKNKPDNLIVRTETHVINPADVPGLSLWLYRDPSKDKKDANGNVIERDEGEFMRSTRLYNRANFILRQAYTKRDDRIPNYMEIISSKGTIGKNDLTKEMRALEEPAYMKLKFKHTAQKVVEQACDAFRSWINASQSYEVCPEKFTAKPKMPGKLKKGKRDKPNELVFTDCFSLDGDGFVTVNGFTLPLHTNLKHIQRVVFVPYHTDRVKVLLVYRTTREEQVKRKGYDDFHGFDFDKALAIDLGVGNLLTITSDGGSISNIVNGGPVKSDNRYYNKCRAQIKSALDKQGLEDSKRLRRLERKHLDKLKDFFHKAARRVVEMMVYWGIGTCIVGLNEGWKQRLNDADEEKNQNFLQIPHSMFVEMLRYKVEEIGGKFIVVNEAYTSLCSAYDGEKVCRHPEYLGSRPKRGKFVTAYGRHMVNADVNGSLNILRKGTNRDVTWHAAFFNPWKLDIEQRYARVLLSCGIACRGASGGATGPSGLKGQTA